MKPLTRIAAGCLIGVCALSTAPWLHAQRLPGDGRVPKLLVLLMVDQMRGDYVDKFHHQWQGGLHRLLANGAWFRQANYPYFNTVTCAGHASVSTGATPAIHGMILNGWWEADTHKQVSCTEDASVTTISYGKAVVAEGASAARLATSTLADELRTQLSPPAHIVAMSLKARSAVTLGGQRPDAVAWFEDSGTWVTSTAFAKAPVPAVADFIAHNSVDQYFGKVWDRSLPKDQYLYEDPPIGLRPARGGMTGSLPHLVKGPEEQPGRTFYDQWQSSPFADEYLAHMGMTVADALQLGRHAAPDFLAISFAALDKVGHDYGPQSHEVQEILMRLDRTIGELLAGLDRMVGPGNYTVALTADHGVPSVPERTRGLGLDAGRLSVDTLVSRAEQSMVTMLGPGRRVSKFMHDYLYLEPGAYDDLRAHNGGLRALASDLRAVPGVLRAYSRDELEANHFDGDTIGAQAALSYYPGRSGDVMVILRPNWIESSGTTSHGSGYAYDTHVPVMLMGTGIAPGEYLQPVSPTDVAPTLAFLAGITLHRASGRVLVEALSPPLPGRAVR